MHIAYKPREWSITITYNLIGLLTRRKGSLRNMYFEIETAYIVSSSPITGLCDRGDLSFSALVTVEINFSVSVKKDESV